MPSSPAETTSRPPGRKATNVTRPPCRSRTVPIRARAPGGRGSPWRSVRPASPPSAAGAASPATGAAGAPARAAGWTRARAPTPSKPIITESRAAILSLFSTSMFSPLRARAAAAGEKPPAACPAAKASADRAVAASKAGGTAADAPCAASTAARAAPDKARPRRARRARIKERAWARRVLTVPAGQVSSRAASACVLPARSHSSSGARYFSGSRHSSSSTARRNSRRLTSSAGSAGMALSGKQSGRSAGRTSAATRSRARRLSSLTRASRAR